MATKDDFNESLREIADLVDTVGDEITSDISGQTNQGASLDGYECRRKNHTYQIIGTQVWDHFVIRYPYNAAHQLAALQARANMDPQSSGEVNIGQAEVKGAIENIRERLGEDEIDGIQRELVNLVGEPEFAVNTRLEAGLVVEFNIDRRIFPYAEGFTVRKFDQAVQGVVTLGTKGSNFLNHRYKFGEFADEFGLNARGDKAKADGGQDELRGFQ